MSRSYGPVEYGGRFAGKGQSFLSPEQEMERKTLEAMKKEVEAEIERITARARKELEGINKNLSRLKQAEKNAIFEAYPLYSDSMGDCPKHIEKWREEHFGYPKKKVSYASLDGYDSETLERHIVLHFYPGDLSHVKEQILFALPVMTPSRTQRLVDPKQRYGKTEDVPAKSFGVLDYDCSREGVWTLYTTDEGKTWAWNRFSYGSIREEQCFDSLDAALKWGQKNRPAERNSTREDDDE